MNNRYTIGELAQGADVPVSTVRYYERRGLMLPDARTDSNYRLYGDESLRRLRFIRAAQAAGFTLTDVKALLRFRDGESAPCCEVQDLIGGRLERVRTEIEQLRQIDQMLRGWLEVCRSAESTGRCGVLDGLTETEQNLSKKT